MTPEQVAEVAAQVARLGGGPEHAAALRETFPLLHFSHCNDDDVIRARPVFEGEGFNLNLVDGRDHCLTLTSEPYHAGITGETGLREIPSPCLSPRVPAATF